MSGFTPAAISEFLRERINTFERKGVVYEYGIVSRVSDGVVRVDGLSGRSYGELLEFDGGVYGMVMDLEENGVGAVLLDNSDTVGVGDRVRGVDRIVEIPVSDSMIGRVLDPVGRPLDGEAYESKEFLPVERSAPPLIHRHSVDEPLETGIIAIDSMVPIGRGQRELIIGDRQTGKTTIALQTIMNQKNTGVICIYCAIGQKASTVAHVIDEIRTAGADSYTFVVAACASDSPAMQYLHKADELSDHLLSLINDILDMSKIESGKVELRHESFNFRAFLQDFENLYGEQAKSKGISYETVLASDLEVQIIGDSLRLNQVLSNLLSNALKFTPAKGIIKLRVSKTGEDQENVYLRFEVIDTGCGIAEENYDKIFESFEQENVDVTYKYGGTGLGLSIVKRFTQLMGGGIHVTSVQGSGSTFTVDLPFGKIKESGKPTRFSDIDGRSDLARDCYVIDYDFKGKRILLVEDNELNREIAEELIGATGASVESAEDGVQAVKKFKESAEGYYDLILMDVQMPHMDGYEATRCIRALGRSDAQKVPIFAMTANAFAEDVQKSREAGMNAHISKPLDIRAVYKQMNRYLQG